ncbi:TaqI-like C-terminal specificity domain-containing protein, partial [Brachyspira sp.]|uniref:TaqI-like C-terminal specificity domain-containing protein n=1 Tax=Brachyspira sp. TaxID=1977261 RepID=UPI0026332406
FYEKCLSLLSSDGVSSLITSNKWMRAGYGASTREYFYKNADVLRIIDLGAGRFESATVDVNIILYSKTKEKYRRGERSFDGVSYSGNLKELNSAKFNTVVSDVSKEWVIMNTLERSIFNKIKNNKTLIDYNININRGITTGLNDAFIIDENTKNELIKKDKNSKKLIKKLVRGRDINRYLCNFSNLYFINTHNGLKEKNIKPININDYPAIKKHLDKYYKQLEKRQDKGVTPYNLRNCTYIEDFEKPKIIYQEICKEASYTFDEESCFLSNNAYMITSENYNLKVLLGLLNSKLYWWFFTKNNIALGSSAIRMLAMYIVILPIPEVDSKTKNKIVKLADKIIELKKQNENTSDLEDEIDKIVYSLYGLNDEEIRVINDNIFKI